MGKHYCRNLVLYIYIYIYIVDVVFISMFKTLFALQNATEGFFSNQIVLIQKTPALIKTSNWAICVLLLWP